MHDNFHCNVDVALVIEAYANDLTCRKLVGR